MVKSTLIFLKTNLSSKMEFFTTLSPLVAGVLCVFMFLCLVDKNGQENAKKFGCVLIFKIWVYVHSVLVEDEPRSKFMYFLNFNYVVFFLV